MSQELNGTLINVADLDGTQTSDILNYNDFTHKPQVNGVELIGNKTGEDLGLASTEDIPTKTSDLENDSDFVTSNDLPTKTSDLENDSGFITENDIPPIPSKTSDLQNDSGFITSSALPTKTSDLQNDSGYITSSALPTKTSDLTNDSGFITQNDIPAIPSKTSDLQNDSGFITSADIPTKTSELENDSNFATTSDIPTNTSDLYNDSGFITSSAIPTKTSDLENDSGFAVIDDTVTANNKAWSSGKISGELGNKADKSTVDEISVEVPSKNLFVSEYSAGYISTSTGEVVPSTASSYGDYIDIKNPSDRITISANTSFGNVSFRYALYDAQKQFISGALVTNNDVSLLDTRYYMTLDTTGAKYMRFSCTNAYMSSAESTGKLMIEYGDAPTTYEAHTNSHYEAKPDIDYKIIKSMTISSLPQKAIDFSMADGDIKSLDNNNLKKNFDLVFFGKITTFNELWIGHGISANGYYFVINNTNIIPTTNGSAGSPFAHGLTIEDYISIELKVEALGKCSIRVNTKGGSYIKIFSSGFIATKGDIFVKSNGSALTDCSFNWVCNDYKKRIWVFGDSYLSVTSNKRWAYWLLTWGHDNSLLNGYAGENSKSAYADFMQTLKHGTPKYVVWCLGMNDQDSSSAINADYKKYVELVMAKCEELGITLILATIPIVTATPTSNNYKNAYVRASGYRYIDFANAVDGISGWLDTDNVHPNEIGARLLCSEALASVPELMLES